MVVPSMLGMEGIRYFRVCLPAFFERIIRRLFLVWLATNTSSHDLHLATFSLGIFVAGLLLLLLLSFLLFTTRKQEGRRLMIYRLCCIRQSRCGWRAAAIPRMSAPRHGSSPIVLTAQPPPSWPDYPNSAQLIPSSDPLDIPRWHRSSTWPRPLRISEMDVSLRLRAFGLHHGRRGTRPSLVCRRPLLPPSPPLPPREHNAVSHRTAMSHCLHLP
ncbi:hypothetical protein BDP55DRAFT_105019 [Colletotrichum godetiae]|uniref:Uncharacterized protein n=1 Tax=Colletotrichum godetiae TaxID=1209918 RepID=A0AAJ0ANG2_9PEZI|nr:uncharacterized protein BDP55DRAFT_105019 [Colletotrichum godetiae]KAK1676475.1 hypothetical protein BDP55DRAFT_105019 [Colletotrichum godetiae]